MSENNNQVANIDDLLDGTLDDLSDVPSFKPFAEGAHMCKINWEVTAINNIPTVKLKLAHVSTEELVNAEDTAPVPGDETEVAFMLKKKDNTKNELAEGQWKEILAALKAGIPELAAATNREVMEATNNMEVLVVTNIRKNAKDPADIKYYTGVKSVSVV